MVALHVDPGPGEKIAELPAWVRPARGDGYWHAPRSARRMNRGRISVSFWCGPGRGNARLRDFTDAPPEQLKCGTCVGRRDGFTQAGGLVFRPRDHFTKLPTRCPGRDRGDGTCAMCGGRARYRRDYAYYTEIDHRPTTALFEFVDPCPEHGWTRMRSDAGCSGTRERAARCDWNGWRITS